jgi:hypothetical protein
VPDVETLPSAGEPVGAEAPPKNGAEAPAESGVEAATENDTSYVEHDDVDPAAQPATGTGTPGLPPRLLMALGIGALGLLCIVGLALHLKSTSGPPEFQDLGAGISNATGMKGRLKARWQGNSAQYQLEIEPMDPLQSAGFSFVVANPPGPLVLHMKLLDATGYVVCGKDVLFPFDPSDPGEADRERGQDLFETAVDDSGKVVSLSAQGNLPCTPDQYKRVDYWDFSTNFPAVDEQEQLMKQTADAKKMQEAQERRARARRNAPRSIFYMEGDENVSEYDASRNVLQTSAGREFRVTGASQQATAGVWADTGVLFHYKCDQSAHCVLSRPGGGVSLSVTALQ